MSLHRMSAVAATIVVIAAIVWGFVLAGSPNTRRLVRLDERRIEDLQRIVREMQTFLRDTENPSLLFKRSLPQTLEELAGEVRGERLRLEDPETGRPYVYIPKDWKTYQLCATFALKRDASSRVFWNHPAGDHCFTIDVLDPP